MVEEKDFFKFNDKISVSHFPLYSGNTYDIDEILFSQFGAKCVVRYFGDEVNSGLTEDEYNCGYSSILKDENIPYRYNIGKPLTYNYLMAEDDLTTQLNDTWAIPTKDELSEILKDSYIYYNSNGYFSITPKESVFNIKIPTIGYYIVEKNGENYKYKQYDYFPKKQTSGNIYAYLLTSTLEENGKGGLNYIYARIQTSFTDDGQSPGEVEFYSISADYERAFMILPIKRNNDVNLTLCNKILFNNEPAVLYNQDINQSVAPVITYDRLGIPQITNGMVKHYFAKFYGNNTFGVSFGIDESLTIQLNEVVKSPIEDNGYIKIEYGNGYVKIPKNVSLFYYDEETNHLIYNKRSLFGIDGESTFNGYSEENYIDINFNGVPCIEYKNFVVPSIYKPFYINGLYSLDFSYADHIYTTVIKSIYNGIGLYEPNGKYVIGNIDTYIGFYVGTWPIVEVFEIMNDTITISRQKPLILSNYNDSVCDDVCPGSIENWKLDNLNSIVVNNNFKSVISNIYNNFRPNSDKTYERTVSFFPYTSEIFTCDARPNGFHKDGQSGYTIYSITIDNESEFISYLSGESGTTESGTTESGITDVRYYIVNNAFYKSYIDCVDSKEYCNEYINNREHYDLNPHKVDFNEKRNDEYIWKFDDTENPKYIPFLNMIPSLKQGFINFFHDEEYGKSEFRYDIPMAVELCVLENYRGEKYIGCKNESGFNFNGGENVYIIGCCSPLTELDDVFYEGEINDGNVLIPQNDFNTILVCYQTTVKYI